MTKALESVLKKIAAGQPPSIILVGGNSEYLAEAAYRDIRDRCAALPGVQVETFGEGTDLSSVIDSYRTFSLFGGKRLLLLPEVNAFVTKKEIRTLLEKAIGDWTSAKTDRKRASSVAKLLHVLGLAGLDLDMTDSAIATALGETRAVPEMLALARLQGKRASRGEGDAAMLGEAATRGGSPGTTLLMRTGELPDDSATIDIIARAGAIVRCDLDRDAFSSVLRAEIEAEASERKVRFDSAAVQRLADRVGISRVLADKFSKDVPDLRSALSEAVRLMTLAGEGGVVDAKMIDAQVGAVAGGARYELGGLYAERKAIEAVQKLRDLVAQSRRDDPRSTIDIHYGKFLFPLADEVRQLIGVLSFARIRKIDPRVPVNYNRFKDSLADALGGYLKDLDLVRQRPHPFALHKKWEAARNFSEAELWDALRALAEVESGRKSGGVSPEIGIEALLLSAARSR